MDKKTKAALEGSIKKWKGIVKGIIADEGIDNCPLCKMFFSFDYSMVNCEGCPVKARTGYSECKHTPYEWWGEYTDRTDTFFANDDEGKKLAQDELDFLISLREPE